MTSIEWLFEKLWDEPKDKLTWYSILSKAKEMHKQEIIEAYESPREFEDGEEYFYQNYLP